MKELGFKIRHLRNEFRWVKEPEDIEDKPVHVLTHQDATEYDTDFKCGRALKAMGLPFKNWGVFRIVEDE